MSNSSIDRQHSPTIEPAGPAEGAVRSAAEASERQDEDPEPVPAPAHERPMSSLPIDQDLFDSHPPSQPHNPGDSDEAASYLEPPTDQALLPPPDFKPFFTLITSPDDSSEHAHPTVHYLFSDDDPEIWTCAALQSIEEGAARTERRGQDDRSNDGPEEDGGEDVEERTVIVDIGAYGKTVANVSSLSGRWQALRTEVGAAPSMGGEKEGDEGKGLMLRISGREVEEMGEARRGDIEELGRAFGERVGGLEGLMGTEEDAKGDGDEVGREEEMCK